MKVVALLLVAFIFLQGPIYGASFPLLWIPSGFVILVLYVICRLLRRRRLTSSDRMVVISPCSQNTEEKPIRG